MHNIPMPSVLCRRKDVLVEILFHCLVEEEKTMIELEMAFCRSPNKSLQWESLEQVAWRFFLVPVFLFLLQ
jgi:hypothetical protein